MSAPRYAREPNMNLGATARLFLRERSPQFLIVHLAAWLGARIWLLTQGEVGRWDLAPLILIPLLQPLAEWLIHVFVLHHRPRDLFGWRWDYHAARYHRLHHRDPWDLRFVLMPVRTMIGGLGVGALGMWLITPNAGVWATAMVIVAAFALYYEWVHFLTHTSYRPKGWLLTRQRRLHRLHHYKNERYWMGVTRHMGDMLLGTLPEASEVERSKTARTLGIDDDDIDDSGDSGDSGDRRA